MKWKTGILWLLFCGNSLFLWTVKAQVTDSVGTRQPVFFDNFSKDILGKFPLNWVSNRPGEVVTLKGIPGKWLKMHAEGTYLPLLGQDLPGNFTIDFDFIHQAIGNGNNTTEITLFRKPKDAVNDALLPGDCGIKIVLETFIVSCLGYDNTNPCNQVSAEYRSQVIQANKIARVSIKVEDQLLSVTINGFECLHVPQCKAGKEPFNAIRFYLWGSQAEPLISNLRVREL